MMSSLSARLLIAVSLVLAVFFGATVLVLDSAFRHAAERAVEERLDVQIFLLLAEAEPASDGGLELPDDLPEPRFSTAGSGLYAQINTADGTPIWRSQSAVGRNLPMLKAGGLGEYAFSRTELADGTAVFMQTLNVEWEFEDGSAAGYQLGVAESLDPFLDQVRRYRRQLYGWFAGLAVALVITLGILLRWVLSPLRKIEREIREVESGARPQLSEKYPRELQGLTRNTNRLILAERTRLERYRNTLGNLAHSLKTPLAVIRSLMESKKTDDGEIGNQLERMDEIIGYQLNRAAASGAITLGQEPVDVAAAIAAVVRALDKVYADKAIICRCQLADGVAWFGDKGDFTEIAGNLLDNAYKYGNSKVQVSAQALAAGDSPRAGLELVVEDDGAGIEPAAAEALFQRGVRADQHADGHGLGLAMVREIVELAGGELQIARSRLGGASITVRLTPP
ncbi:MAG: histidine kinase [Gammaproteobacteria bacterium]|nr:histidine kinase [Gammaproteobacteria bacterium]